MLGADLDAPVPVDVPAEPAVDRLALGAEIDVMEVRNVVGDDVVDGRLLCRGRRRHHAGHVRGREARKRRQCAEIDGAAAHLRDDGFHPVER